MAETHTNAPATPAVQVKVNNPDNGNGSNAKIEGTTADGAAKVISVGGTASTAWKNPA
jgi:hypothetical protein